MLYPIGTKVVLRHTGEIATVTAQLGDGMLSVCLQGDIDDFPVTETDVQLPHQYQAPAPKPSAMPAATQPPTEKIYATTAEVQPLGVHLAFVPRYKAETVIDSYDVYLLNCLPYQVVMSVALSLANDLVESYQEKMEEFCALPIGELLYDELNDHPAYALTLQRVSTAGLGDSFQKNVKLKAKQFFAALAYAPILEEEAVLVTALEHLDQTKQTVLEDMKEYMRTHKPRATPSPLPATNRVALHDIHSKAHFKTELDLHIEQLTDRHAGMSNAEIIQVQLQRFERYLQEAIQLGVHKVHIIHGLGKGKLRNEIAQRLSHHPAVKSFKNEYHPLYGWGATEVWL